MISGVCGGLGEYFGLDPILIRAAFIIAVISFGTGLLVYIILWFITPVEPYRAESFDGYYTNYWY